MVRQGVFHFMLLKSTHWTMKNYINKQISLLQEEVIRRGPATFKNRTAKSSAEVWNGEYNTLFHQRFTFSSPEQSNCAEGMATLLTFAVLRILLFLQTPVITKTCIYQQIL